MKIMHCLLWSLSVGLELLKSITKINFLGEIGGTNTETTCKQYERYKMSKFQHFAFQSHSALDLLLNHPFINLSSNVNERTYEYNRSPFISLFRNFSLFPCFLLNINGKIFKISP